MGLDAYVLRAGHFADDDDERDHVVAEHRLGNIVAIAYVKERIARLLPDHSILLTRVVYSGSHTCDSIEPELLPALRSELIALGADRDDQVARFRRRLGELVDAALREGTALNF